MDKLKTVLTRIIASIILIFCLQTVGLGVNILVHAETFIDLIKSLILMLVGGGSSYFAVEDFKHKKWPFED